MHSFWAAFDLNSSFSVFFLHCLLKAFGMQQTCLCNLFLIMIIFWLNVHLVLRLYGKNTQIQKRLQSAAFFNILKFLRFFNFSITFTIYVFLGSLLKSSLKTSLRLSEALQKQPKIWQSFCKKN